MCSEAPTEHLSWAAVGSTEGGLTSLTDTAGEGAQLQTGEAGPVAWQFGKVLQRRVDLLLVTEFKTKIVCSEKSSKSSFLPPESGILKA